MAPLVDLVNSRSELSVEEQQGDVLPLDHASFPYSSDNFRVPYIVTNFRKNTEESVGLEAMLVRQYRACVVDSLGVGITCVLYHSSMCTRHPNLVSSAFYAIPIFHIII